jgi:hypothetical protein
VTIRPGAAWGRAVTRPDGLVTVDSDAAFVDALAMGDGHPIAVGSGDLARTLGVTSPDHRSTTINEFSIDLLHVRLDRSDTPDTPDVPDTSDEPIVACAHVVARSPWRRGHWFRGPILAVMNAEFLGEWDVAPRGHPNDGRVEVFDVDASMSVRDRLAARRRLRTATHVPHPRVATRSIRSGTWNFVRPLEVVVDGRHVGRASSLRIDVVADAATVHA